MPSVRQFHNQVIDTDTVKTQHIPITKASLLCPVHSHTASLQPSHPPQTLEITDLVSISLVLSLRECRANGILQPVPKVGFLHSLGSSDSVSSSPVWVCGPFSCGGPGAGVPPPAPPLACRRSAAWYPLSLHCESSCCKRACTGFRVNRVFAFLG